MKIKVLSIMLLVASALITKVNAQCAVTKSVLENNLISYTTDKERVYRNEDLENGVQMVQIQMDANQKAPNETQYSFNLYVFVGSSEPKMPIAPRVILLTLSNRTTLTLKANKIKTIHKEELTVNACTFELSSDDVDKITSYAILNMEILDNRLGANLKFKPYDMLILEQTTCLAKAIIQK